MRSSVKCETILCSPLITNGKKIGVILGRFVKEGFIEIGKNEKVKVIQEKDTIVLVLPNGTKVTKLLIVHLMLYTELYV